MLLPTTAFAAQLPEQTQEILRTAPDIAQVSSWTLDGLWAAALRILAQPAAAPLRFFVQLCGYLLLCGVLGLLCGKTGWRACLDCLAVLGFGGVSLAAMMQLVQRVSATALDCRNYLAAFIPVYSGAVALGGQNAGAAAYSGLFYAVSGLVGGVIGQVLLPVMQVYFCFAACACIWGDAGIEEAARLFSRCLVWLLKGCGAVFGFVLGLQNILAGAVDSAALKTGRSVLQGLLPVVGDAAAAALTGAASAVHLLKGSLALAGMAALTALFAPGLLQCFLYAAAFGAAGTLASFGGQKQCGRLCALYGEGAKLCASVLVLYLFMVLLSTALLLLTGNGG